MAERKLKKKKKKKLKKGAQQEPGASAPQEPPRKRKQTSLFGSESSVDRTPVPSSFWHRPPTSDVLAAKDDFEALGLVGSSLAGMPTEAMFRDAAQRRAFAIRTDHCVPHHHS